MSIPIDDDGYQRWCDEWEENRELLLDELYVDESPWDTIEEAMGEK